MDRERPDNLTLAAFAATVLLASANIVAVRFSNRELDPFWGAGLRFGVASAVMFALAAWGRLPLPRGPSLRGAVTYGLLAFGGAYAFFYWGAVEVPAGFAGVIMGSVPLITVILAALQRVEPFRMRGLAGAMVATAGVALIVAEPPGGTVALASVLAVFAAATCAAESGVVVKKIPASHPITTNAVAMAIGTVVLVGLSLVTGERAALPSSPSVWIAVSYVSLVGSPLLFVLYVFVLQRWTVSGASYQFVLIPPVTIVMGTAIAGEPVTIALLIGTPLVLAGVYVGALGRRPRSARLSDGPPRHGSERV